MRRSSLPLAVVLAAGLSCAVVSPGRGPEPASSPARRSRPEPVLDLAAVDPGASPCDDFFAHACGRWLVDHPMPPDRARWGRFDALSEHARGILHEILVEAAEGGADRSRIEQQVGDYYDACIDLDRLDRLGLAPLAEELVAIDRVTTPEELTRLLGTLHRMGVAALFSFSTGRGLRDASRYELSLDEGELGLPSREDYLSGDPAAAAMRDELVRHVARQLEGLGLAGADARRDSGLVLEIETELARVAMPPAERYLPQNRDHPATVDELDRRHPGLRLPAYLRGIGAPRLETLNVVNPAHLALVERLLGSRPLEHWRSYLRWHLVREAAPFLPRRFVEEEARFAQLLGGQTSPEPREKRCTRYVEMDLSHPVGRLYVERAFGPEAKARVRAMVAGIEGAMAAEIHELDWMGEATKAAALAKLAAVGERIGYPDAWRDYSGLRIVRGDALGNSLRANAFELAFQLARAGAPSDPHEWLMAASAGNAYYDNGANLVVFPAGILQPPFFDPRMDDAVNYGAIGFVIGHELTHGFDSAGRSYDATGSLRDWWTREDAASFDERAACLVAQYGGYRATDVLPVDGALTLGENIADHGGVRLALRALRAAGGAAGAARDGLTPEQRFFLAYAQGFCSASRPEEARRRALVDHHAPNRYRVNGVVSGMPEFAEAFSCVPGDAMVRASPCGVW